MTKGEEETYMSPMMQMRTTNSWHPEEEVEEWGMEVAVCGTMMRHT